MQTTVRRDVRHKTDARERNQGIVKHSARGTEIHFLLTPVLAIVLEILPLVGRHASWTAQMGAGQGAALYRSLEPRYTPA